MKQSQIFLILLLLALLFFVNIPPSNIDGIKTKLTGNDINQTPLNLTPFNQTINRTTIFVNNEGQEVGRVTQQYNETIYPQAPTEENKDLITKISNLGKILWPSNELFGWVIIGLVAYFIIWPMLKWLKEMIGF